MDFDKNMSLFLGFYSKNSWKTTCFSLLHLLFKKIT